MKEVPSYWEQGLKVMRLLWESGGWMSTIIGTCTLSAELVWTWSSDKAVNNHLNLYYRCHRSQLHYHSYLLFNLRQRWISIVGWLGYSFLLNYNWLFCRVSYDEVPEIWRLLSCSMGWLFNGYSTLQFFSLLCWESNCTLVFRSRCWSTLYSPNVLLLWSYLDPRYCYDRLLHLDYGYWPCCWWLHQSHYDRQIYLIWADWKHWSPLLCIPRWQHCGIYSGLPLAIPQTPLG